MRHAKYKYRLNRHTSWRRATVISLVKSLLIYESIQTTRIKAKAARQLADKLIALAKDNSLIAKRRAYKILGEHALVQKLFTDIAPRFNTSGGYTRMLNTGKRRGDDAEMVVFQLTVLKKKEPKKHKREKEKKPVDQLPEAQEKQVTEGESKKPAAKQQEVLKEKPPVEQKPPKKFLGGLRNIFKKERDSL